MIILVKAMVADVNSVTKLQTHLTNELRLVATSSTMTSKIPMPTTVISISPTIILIRSNRIKINGSIRVKTSILTRILW